MNRLTSAISKLFRDETGSEVTEYALVLGLIIVLSITMIYNFGVKVLARWASVNSSM